MTTSIDIHDIVADKTAHDGVIVAHSRKTFRVVNPDDVTAVPKTVNEYRFLTDDEE